MNKLSDYLGTELTVIQPSVWKREIEFRSEKELIATLAHPKFFSEKAECKINNEIYEFYRQKFFSRNVDIRKKGYQNPFAHLKPNFWASKGILELPRGIKLNIKFGVFKKAAEIYEGDYDLLVTINNKISFKERCLVNIERKSEVLDEHPWIIMLAFFFAQLRRRNSTG